MAVLFPIGPPVFNHSIASRKGAGDHIRHWPSSSAISNLQHTTRAPKPAVAAPIRVSQTRSTDGQSVSCIPRAEILASYNLPYHALPRFECCSRSLPNPLQKVTVSHVQGSLHQLRSNADRIQRVIREQIQCPMVRTTEENIVWALWSCDCAE